MKRGYAENGAEKFALALSAMYPEQESSPLPPSTAGLLAEGFKDDNIFQRLCPHVMEGRFIPSFLSRRVLKNWWDVRNGSQLLWAMRNLLDYGHRSSWQDAAGHRVGIAWDMARVGNLARLGINAHYVTWEQAWPFVRESAPIAQRSFNSWADYGRAYLAGLERWRGEKDEDFPPVIERLLSHPLSPWVRIDFKAPLVWPSSS